MENAVSQRLPTEYQRKINNILVDYKHIFRNKIGGDRPASIPPMTLKLNPGAQPIRTKVRRYSQPQKSFLKKKIQELENLRLIYKTPTSRWASASVIVPKPKSAEEWRMKFDLQAIKELTERYLWPMPDFETISPSLRRSKFYALLDFC